MKNYEYYNTKKKIEKAEAYCNKGNLESLIKAVPSISDVLDTEENEKALELKNKIIDELKKYRESMNLWLTLYESDIRPSLPNIYPEFYKLIEYLDFDKITELDSRKSSLLLLLWGASRPESSIDEIENFIKNCKSFDNRFSREYTKLSKEYPKIEKAENLCSNQDILGLIRAAGIIGDILENDPMHTEALSVKNKISETLTEYQKNMKKWLLENQTYIQLHIPEIFPRLLKSTDNLNFNNITELNENQKKLLLSIYNIYNKETTEVEFIARCKQLNNPYNVLSIDDFTK